MQIVYFTINFVAFIFILYWFLRKPISKYLNNRKSNFIKDSTEAKTYYDTAFNKLNEIKGKLLDIEKEGDSHVDNAIKQAKEEANIIILNAKNRSNNILASSKDLVIEELKRARDRQVMNFVHSVVAKTKVSAKEDATSKDYNDLYMKDYFVGAKDNEA